MIEAGNTVLTAGGAKECTADVGDIVLMDSRLMRLTEKNELFNRSKVWLAFHYDFTDTPAPFQWLPRTVWMNFIAVALIRLDELYKKLPLLL
jgi:hypothetical protein